MKTQENVVISASAKYHKKYSYLVEHYVRKVTLYDNAMTVDDVRQELNLKMFLAIQGYGKAYLKYKRTGRYKPVPLRFYLQTAMNNKMRDILRKNSTDLIKGSKLKIEEGSFDYGMNDIERDVVMDYKNHRYILNGYNLLETIEDRDRRACMSLYLSGMKRNKLNSMFYRKFKDIHGATLVINECIELWKCDPKFKEAISDIDNTRHVGFMFDEA